MKEFIIRPIIILISKPDKDITKNKTVFFIHIDAKILM